ncbi:hypothetical protein EON64_01450 [archaeon]|nr:MAG: hypothetical protein EON64_01450 [archaeon]
MSQSQANQRAGRAGREAAGKCFRLYTEAAFQQLAAHTVPEVQRIDLAQVILQLLALGIHSILDFDWLTKPDLEVMKKALKLLISLRAVDEVSVHTYFKM